ncbi:hypothetical protein H8711_02070 [Clostridiaceae bacterium NSJ-31]|uniref:VCBS repeat-containing protein n=1 Tax=Ligaoa zhengdingensis TaxID=2763658 RepID=A0A926DY36_9FIRM|nr:hypothetical protein [Ligaoa zhengdingensis]MBC8545724.1 hypothetical protein [Ligaoa zhengdingensis]
MRFQTMLLLLTTICCALLFSSCARLELSPENLMDAPLLTSEQSAIREALFDGTRTRDVKFKYPKAGDYRSAFVMHDIDGDGKEEAIVFYDPQMGNANAMMGILVQTDEGWVFDYSIPGQGDSVELVQFGSMLEQGAENIIVGWSRGGGEKTVAVYRYQPQNSQDKLENLLTSSSGQYNELMVYDFNRDGLTELLLLRTGSPEARLVSAGKETGELDVSSKIELSGSISEIQRVKIGQLTSEIEAVFIDSRLQSGRFVTDILKYEAESPRRMVNVISQYNKQLSGTDEEIEENEINLKREQRYYCEDIDGDGVMEIPYQPSESSVLPGYSEDSDADKLYSARYVRFDGERFEQVWYGVVNPDAGYRLEFPEQWMEGEVTVAAEVATGEWRFLEYGGSLAASYRELLRINVVNRNSPPDKNAGEDQYKLLGSRGYYDYKVYYPAVLEDESFRVTESDIGRCFSLLP